MRLDKLICVFFDSLTIILFIDFWRNFIQLKLSNPSIILIELYYKYVVIKKYDTTTNNYL